ncbi:MAG: ribonuclease III [Bacteroidetes bacterium]|nr:ribonuclease III [Bacteroidota bacterium]
MIKILSSFQFTDKENKAFKQGLKQLLGFSPKNLSLYHQAFRHSSSKNIRQNHLKSNERLEFLGDAVLGVVIADYLFKLYPYEDEGFLTQLRSRIVNGQVITSLAQKFGLDTYLQSDLSKKEKVKSSAYGDAFEALVGAIYLDKGFETTRKFLIERVISIHVDVKKLQAVDTDYKSQLQIMMQRQRRKFEYRLVSEVHNGKEKIYKIQVFIENKPFAEFQHYSKRVAEQKAAQLTLEMLEQTEKP